MRRYGNVNASLCHGIANPMRIFRAVTRPEGHRCTGEVSITPLSLLSGLDRGGHVSHRHGTPGHAPSIIQPSSSHPSSATFDLVTLQGQGRPDDDDDETANRRLIVVVIIFTVRENQEHEYER